MAHKPGITWKDVFTLIGFGITILMIVLIFMIGHP
jgi:hypothetical protein